MQITEADIADLTTVFTNALEAMVATGAALTLLEVLAALNAVQQRVIAEALAEERKG